MDVGKDECISYRDTKKHHEDARHDPGGCSVDEVPKKIPPQSTQVGLELLVTKRLRRHLD